MIAVSTLGLAGIARFCLTACTLIGLLSAQPKLEITSPADGTVVNPGKEITVTVLASPSGVFQQVALIGGNPIGFYGPITAAPYQFTVQIPTRINPGEYPLTAHGFTSPGHGTRSEPITIVVERADFPVSLEVYPPSMQLSVGRKGFLSVTGVFSDGERVNLWKASKTVYTSDRLSVATVQAQGVVTGVAPGSAKVGVTYGKITVEVPVTVGKQRAQ